MPFAQIFEALDRGADPILLGNGTYFSLRRPEFKTLRTLIAEARELDDAGGELRINRHQAGLFSELESLAASVHTTARWMLRCVRCWSWLRAWRMPAALKRVLKRP